MPTKLVGFFSLKDKMPNALRTHVAYKFNCAGCTASYIQPDTLPLALMNISTHLECANAHRDNNVIIKRK